MSERANNNKRTEDEAKLPSPIERKRAKHQNVNEEKERLLHVLKTFKNAKDVLHTHFLKKIQSNDEEAIKQLGDVFPIKKFKIPENGHCARCHKTFDINNPKKGECQIEHEMSWDSPTSNDFILRMNCCGYTWEIDDIHQGCEGPPTKYCFKGKHTPSAVKVNYKRMNSEPCAHKECNL